MKLLDLPAAGRDEDYVTWIERQMALLRAHQFDQLDLDFLLEELEGLVAAERRELRSRLDVILVYLIKCRYQPSRKETSWLRTLNEQRRRVEFVLDDSPSLRRWLPELLTQVWPKSRKKALQEMGLDATHVPEQAVFSLDQVLDDEYVP